MPDARALREAEERARALAVEENKPVRLAEGYRLPFSRRLSQRLQRLQATPRHRAAAEGARRGRVVGITRASAATRAVLAPIAHMSLTSSQFANTLGSL